MARYIDFKTYEDKLKGCWWGKIAGGTLGAPFEGKRGAFDINYYLQKNPAGVPNDDLDLQLVALKACEVYHNKVDAHILGEYWLSLVSSSISEYGSTKNNLRNRILAPLSGRYNNECKNSNAAFIRSELWACLCAGNPDVAVRYALEDAILDHCDEGVYGEIFCAAIESYAFIESDIDKLIDRALGFIPKDSDTTKAVECVRNSYRNGKTWKEARYELLSTVPGSFGICYSSAALSEEDKKLPESAMFYDAPSNVALGVLGLLYGEGSFERTLCISAGCGEDGDCTCGFAGAVMGIILGYDALPREWIEPLGERIVNCCIVPRDDSNFPTTVSGLCDRVLRLTPLFFPECTDILSQERGYKIKILSPGELLAVWAIRQKGNPHLNKAPLRLEPDFNSSLERVTEKQGMRFQGVLFDTTVFYPDGYKISEGDTVKLHFEFWNKIYEQQQLKLVWYLPSGIKVAGGKYSSLFLDQIHGGTNETEKDFELTLEESKCEELEFVLEIKSVGRSSRTFIPIKLELK